MRLRKIIILLSLLLILINASVAKEAINCNAALDLAQQGTENNMLGYSKAAKGERMIGDMADGLIKCYSPCTWSDVKTLLNKANVKGEDIEKFKQILNVGADDKIGNLNNLNIFLGTQNNRNRILTAINNANNQVELESIKNVLNQIKDNVENGRGLTRVKGEIDLDKNGQLNFINDALNKIDNNIVKLKSPVKESRVTIKSYKEGKSISDLLSKETLTHKTKIFDNLIFNEEGKKIGTFTYYAELKDNKILISAPRIGIDEPFLGLKYTNDYRITFDNQAQKLAKLTNKKVIINSVAQVRTAKAAFKTGNSKVYKNGKLVRSFDEIQEERGVLYQVYTEFNP